MEPRTVAMEPRSVQGLSRLLLSHFVEQVLIVCNTCIQDSWHLV